MTVWSKHIPQCPTTRHRFPKQIMSKILAVFGATGQQGSSVVANVLSDPELSKGYSLRALTRDISSTKAKDLADRGVEVVAADMTSRESVASALQGVHTVFIVTVPTFTPHGFEVEYNTGKLIADVSVELGVSYIIFSTLPHVSKLSGGTFKHVTHFDAKAQIEIYIRTLKVRSAFVSLGAYMQNFSGIPFFTPQKANDSDAYVIALPTSSQQKWPFLDAEADTGKFVGAILAEPEKFEGKVFSASEGLYCWEEIVAALSKSSGKKVVYRQLTVEAFKEGLPFAKDAFAEALGHIDAGYYGSETEALVKWANENARGKLIGLGAYLQAHPLQLV